VGGASRSGYALLLKAIAAIDRPVVFRHEGNGRFLAAGSTLDRVLNAIFAGARPPFTAVACATAIAPTSLLLFALLAAFWAAAGVVQQPFLSIETLFTCRKRKRFTTIAAR
jgi:hypothetical protein